MLTAVRPKGDPSVCSGSCSPSQYTTAYAYIASSGNPHFWGLAVTATDPLGNVAHMTYDGDSNRLQTTDGDGNPTN